jgi:phage protein U
MADVMLRLGQFAFQIDGATYQEFNRTNEYRWQSQPYVNAPPGYQYTGKGEESISLSGVVFPGYIRSFEQLNLMRAEADKGTPLLLVDGRGFVYGRYIIQSISEAVNSFYPQGVPRRQQFNLELKRYGNA